ncbi:MAG: 30S ribosome-binding factor RbfA [Bacteroidota bacterium]
MKEYSLRQNKLGRLIQRELSNIFLAGCNGLVTGSLISVTVVRMSPDLTLAKVYLSIFSKTAKEDVLENIRANHKQIRHLLAQRIKNQVKKIPEVAFFPDDSLDYYDNINNLLKKD